MIIFTTNSGVNIFSTVVFHGFVFTSSKKRGNEIFKHILNACTYIQYHGLLVFLNVRTSPFLEFSSSLLLCEKNVRHAIGQSTAIIRGYLRFFF